MRWYRNSVIGKLMAPILLLLLVGFGLLTVLNGNWLYSMGWEGIREEGNEAALRVATQVEGYFEKYGNIVQALAQSEDVRSFAGKAIYRRPVAHRGDEDYERYLATISRITQQDNNILNML